MDLEVTQFIYIILEYTGKNYLYHFKTDLQNNIQFDTEKSLTTCKFKFKFAYIQICIKHAPNKIIKTHKRHHNCNGIKNPKTKQTNLQTKLCKICIHQIQTCHSKKYMKSNV